MKQDARALVILLNNCDTKLLRVRSELNKNPTNQQLAFIKAALEKRIVSYINNFKVSIKENYIATKLSQNLIKQLENQYHDLYDRHDRYTILRCNSEGQAHAS